MVIRSLKGDAICVLRRDSDMMAWLKKIDMDLRVIVRCGVLFGRMLDHKVGWESELYIVYLLGSNCQSL